MVLTPGRVSVVVPTFNNVENLKKCLLALMQAKGNMPVEIVVIDDGSSDSTPMIVHEFPIKYIKNDRNLGQSSARNRGANYVKSEYILFLDSDVVVPRDCFEQVANFIDMNKPSGLIGLQGIFAIDHPFKEQPSVLYNTLQHLLSREPRYSFGVNTSFLLIKRQEFKTIGGFNENLWFMEDNEFAQRMATKGKYIMRGQIQFIHRKRVSFRQLIHTHILGGKMQYLLATLKPQVVNNTTQLPVKVGINHVFLKWLFAGSLAIAMPAIALAIHNPYLKAFLIIGIAATYLTLMANCFILFKVNKNPVFFLVGTLTYMFLPWLIMLGRLIATCFGVSRKDRKLWIKQ